MLAAERTQLAWWRTAFAVLAVGLAVGKIIPQLSAAKRSGPTRFWARLSASTRCS